jgi:predicted enzyme related to lactoylglutathione lyase
MIDVPEPAFSPSVHFWADAVGRAPSRSPSEADPYLTLMPAEEGVRLTFQRIPSGPPRIHLDIETDDVNAEVRRLEALGGEVVDRVEDWVVLQDPAGLLFCVISVDSTDFDASATRWADGGGSS